MEENKTENKGFLRGSLKEFRLEEILQVGDLAGMTGVLRLKDNLGRVGFLYLDHGKVANCFELASDALTLGNIIQQLDMATYGQVEFATSQQLQSTFGRNIGERMIAMRIIDENQLYEALRTKTLWTVRELGLWREGTYEYIDHSNTHFSLPDGEQLLDMEIMRVTMELVLYADEWSILKRLLPNGIRTMLQIAPAAPAL